MRHQSFVILAIFLATAATVLAADGKSTAKEAGPTLCVGNYHSEADAVRQLETNLSDIFKPATVAATGRSNSASDPHRDESASIA